METGLDSLSVKLTSHSRCLPDRESLGSGRHSHLHLFFFFDFIFNFLHLRFVIKLRRNFNKMSIKVMHSFSD